MPKISEPTPSPYQCILTYISFLGLSSQGKSDRSVSPNMNVEDRRDLLARQHKALYGEQALYDNPGFGDENQNSKAPNTVMATGNTFDQNSPTDPRSGTEAVSSPVAHLQNFTNFDQAAAAQQSTRTSNSSPGESPPRTSNPNGAPGPIGTRSIQSLNPALIKRTTPPTSGPLGLGFNEHNSQGERSGSAASNPPPAAGRDSMTSSGNWGNASGVWGKSSLTGVSSTVWG